MEKTKISRNREITSDIRGSIDHAIENLSRLKTEFEKKGIFDVRVDVEEHWEYGDSRPRAIIRWMEEETDSEYEKRIELERNYRKFDLKRTIKTLEAEGIPIPSELQQEYDALCAKKTEE